MRIVSLKPDALEEIRIDGKYASDSKIDLLADRLANLYIYIQNRTPNTDLNIVFELDFMSAHARLLVARGLKAIAKLCSARYDSGITIEWRYDYKDEDMEEFGEILSELICLPFHFVQTETYNYTKAS